MAKLIIIGIGYKPLDEKARHALARCEFILGSRRLCEVFEKYPEHEHWGYKVKRIDSVDKTFQFIHETLPNSATDIVLLGSGDPLFYGIGARAVRELGRKSVEIIPDMTSLQMTFSRIGEPWEDALLVSFHGGPNPKKRLRLRYGLKDLPGLVDNNDLIGILTDKENGPAVIARHLLTSLMDCSSLYFYVGEKIGYDDERITEGSADIIGSMTFIDPNVVIIKKTTQPDPSIDSKALLSLPRFGLREEEISHSRGLITKDEVRAVTIHSLRLPERGVFWDIGAGSGSVSIEAARMCPGLSVFSIEKNKEQADHIEHNKAAFGTRNVEIVRANAPSALANLPPPDRVFIGGSASALEQIIDAVKAVMAKGIIVINAATIETFSHATEYLERSGFSISISQVSVARSKPVGASTYLEGLNPIFVITGEKG
jgi:precorrin-6B C5,15-methyltransferase / cobalt-precorrin-6B C5,C15-methyltransferase